MHEPSFAGFDRHRLTLLLLLVASGDREAFGDLYDATASTIVQFARHLRHDPREADAMVEAAFLEVWRCAPRYRPSVHPMVWMFELALQTARVNVRPLENQSRSRG